MASLPEYQFRFTSQLPKVTRGTHEDGSPRVLDWRTPDMSVHGLKSAQDELGALARILDALVVGQRVTIQRLS